MIQLQPEHVEYCYWLLWWRPSRQTCCCAGDANTHAAGRVNGSAFASICWQECSAVSCMLQLNKKMVKQMTAVHTRLLLWAQQGLHASTAAEHATAAAEVTSCTCICMHDRAAAAHIDRKLRVVRMTVVCHNKRRRARLLAISIILCIARCCSRIYCCSQRPRYDAERV
jgi:hypothetical protein